MKAGKIFLVGFGPGAESHMSDRAKQAIIESDVVIGYSTYIDLVKDLLQGKEVVRKGMTEEIDRCVEAYAQAKQGKNVALVSSGDIGVYGMAGPTYEVLLQSGWTPDSDIKVEVVPGATALSACASLVGAPLTHDFCSISLSDLLTPWPTIAKRLDAAAQSDFVIALYNPKSGRRRQQIVEAQKILLKYRNPQTPVAIVKSAYRDLQDIQMVTLDSMADCKIGMLTTVLIGNSSTFMSHNLMITPRGYANKYDNLTGETLDGEKRGRSLSMGLEGWQAVARLYLNDNPNTTLRKAAAFFNMSIGDILQAIADTSEDESCGSFKAKSLSIKALDSLLQQATSWGKLRAVVRSEAGAVSELLIQADQLQQRGDWLNIELDSFHLHIDKSKIDQLYLFSNGDGLRSVQFLDIHGNALFNLSLMRTNAQFDATALNNFQAYWDSTSSQATNTQLEDVFA